MTSKERRSPSLFLPFSLALPPFLPSLSLSLLRARDSYRPRNGPGAAPFAHPQLTKGKIPVSPCWGEKSGREKRSLLMRRPYMSVLEIFAKVRQQPYRAPICPRYTFFFSNAAMYVLLCRARIPNIVVQSTFLCSVNDRRNFSAFPKFRSVGLYLTLVLTRAQWYIYKEESILILKGL